MKRTTITMDGYGRVAVPSDTANVWMSEMELVKLFYVIAPILRAAIRAVYKSGVLKPYEVERRIKLTNGYYSEVYSFSMVVALAFRINTSNAVMVRMLYWKGCACEKKGKYCCFQWAADPHADVRLCALENFTDCL